MRGKEEKEKDGKEKERKRKEGKEKERKEKEWVLSNSARYLAMSCGTNIFVTVLFTGGK